MMAMMGLLVRLRSDRQVLSTNEKWFSVSSVLVVFRMCKYSIGRLDFYIDNVSKLV